MFLYRVEYNEFESDIQKNNLLYKTQPKHKKTFEIWKSKSTAYPPKQTRTDVSGHASGAVFRCAFVIKYAHGKTATDACPETSVRVCFGG